MAFPESPSPAEEDKVVCTGEIADVLRGRVHGQLDDVGAANKLGTREVVVLRVSGEGAVVEDQESQESREAVEGPHGDTRPDPGVVGACRRELQVTAWGVSCVSAEEGGNLQVQEGEEHDDAEDMAEDEELIGLFPEWEHGET